MKITSVHRRQSHKKNLRDEHPPRPVVNLTVPAVGSPDPEREEAPQKAEHDEPRAPSPC